MISNVLKVRITKSGGKLYWYRELVGEVFEVYDANHSYIIKEDYDAGEVPWRHISKGDAVAVNLEECDQC